MAGRWDSEADVVVVGFGFAGCAAAITAHDAGARVVMLEKMPEELAGGNSRASGQTWFRTRDEKSAAAYLKSLCGPLEHTEEYVRVWARETGRNTAWLEGLGAEVQLMPFEPQLAQLPGSETYLGLNHVAPGWGHSRLWLFLSRVVRSRGIEIRYATRATELAVDETGAVTGVLCEAGGAVHAIRARSGVVLATGGFENNHQMVREYLGLPSSIPWGSPGNTGDGMRLAQAAGADLWHMTNYCPIFGIGLGEGYQAGSRVLGPGGAAYPMPTSQDVADERGIDLSFIFVGPDGKRFSNELLMNAHGKVFDHGRFEISPQYPLCAIFDEKVRMAGPVGEDFEVVPFGWAQIVEGHRWSIDNIAEIERGLIKKAGTPEELAVAMGLPPEQLRQTIDDYNAACAAGVDEAEGRPAWTLVPLDKPPYYGVSWEYTIMYTCGGPRRDERAQILHVRGEPIRNLYGAGEMSSTYSRLNDAGMMIADALAFGRIAGANAAVAPL